MRILFLELLLAQGATAAGRIPSAGGQGARARPAGRAAGLQAVAAVGGMVPQERIGTVPTAGREHRRATTREYPVATIGAEIE